MKIIKQIHQGDVLFLKLAELPSNAKEINKLKTIESDTQKGIVIQHGEAMGHYHTIPLNQAHNVQAFLVGEEDSVKEMLVKVNEPVDLVHEEHDTLTLDVGFWVARTQREHFRGVTRKVID